MTKFIPNTITSLNLAAGFFAIIYAAGGDPVTASWLILAAMVFDFLDGFSARALKAYSDIGKELDSLADIVSFGVAPAVIIYQQIYSLTVLESSGLSIAESSGAGILPFIAAIMPVCAALRLAVFNLDTTQTTSFRGLPTPANALVVVSLILSEYLSGSKAVSYINSSPVILVILTLVLSLFMVSRVPLLSLKFHDLKLKGNEGRFLLAGMIVVSFAVLRLNAIPLVIPVYIAASLISLLFKKPAVG